METILEQLLASTEPSVRYKTLVNIIGKDPSAPEVRQAQLEIKESARVQTLLSERTSEGQIPWHPYSKWLGAHWVLACLADIGYPPGDESLIPLREQVQNWLLSKEHERSIQILNGRVRRCGSQEGNAVYAMFALGLADNRTEELAQRLMNWQWADGGWNCDKNPSASHSSFMETLIPLRGLSLYARLSGNQKARESARKAAEVFLKRNLYQSQRVGSVIHPDFIQLHYPCYWHYDILFGLKVMAEADTIRDPRCHPALDLLASKQLPTGGFRAEGKYYRISSRSGSGRSLVDWGGFGKKRLNEFITADAAYVLRFR
jgi:hypothetical protein